MMTEGKGDREALGAGCWQAQSNQFLVSHELSQSIKP